MSTSKWRHLLRGRRVGAVLEDMPPDDEVSSMKFYGSTIMVVAESKQAVIDLLKDDVYVKSGVWDLEKVSTPCLPKDLELYLGMGRWADFGCLEQKQGDDLAG